MPNTKFLMDDPVENPIEVRGIRAREHEVEILTIDPIPLLSQASLHGFKEFRPRERVGDRDSDFVRPALPNHFHGKPNIVHGFSRITELKEKPRPYARLPEGPGSFIHLPDRRSLFHCVEDLLGARFGADPDGFAPGTF
jgi:hypothetical protein